MKIFDFCCLTFASINLSHGFQHAKLRSSPHQSIICLRAESDVIPKKVDVNSFSPFNNTIDLTSIEFPRPTFKLSELKFSKDDDQTVRHTVQSKAIVEKLEKLSKSLINASTKNVKIFSRNHTPVKVNLNLQDISGTATKLFKSIMRPSSKKYPVEISLEIGNLALEISSRCGHWNKSLEILEIMISNNIHPTSATYKSLLKSWTGRYNEQVKFVMIVMNAMAKANIGPDIETLETATSMCARANGVKEALYMLELSLKFGFTPSEKMYKVCLRSLGYAGQWNKVLELLNEGEKKLGYTFSADTRMSIMKAAKSLGQIDVIHLMIEQMENGRENGSSLESWPTTQAYTLAIMACSKKGDWKRAIKIMNSMNKGPNGLTPNVFVFNAVLSCCERSKQWDLALELFDYMPKLSLEPDLVTLNTVISACAKGAKWEKALEILSYMRETVKPDNFSYNSAIAACAAASGESYSAFQKSQELLDEMRRRGLQPDKFSYSSAIKACTRTRNSDKALQLLKQMEETEVEADVVVLTAVMDACATTGLWKECIHLLDKMRALNISPNERTYRAAIAACGKGGQWQRALDLLASMRSEGFFISEITFNSAIAACEKGGQHIHALSLIKQMGEAGLSPDRYSYGLLDQP